MNGDEQKNGMHSAGNAMLEDAMLEDVLKSFRQSMQAWSDAAYSRPRSGAQVAARSGWRLATAWALGGVLAVGALGTGAYEHHHREAVARMRAAQVQQQQLAAQERARVADEDLLATVDSDVARTVPAAMEPLAQMMDEGQGQ